MRGIKAFIATSIITLSSVIVTPGLSYAENSGNSSVSQDIQIKIDGMTKVFKQPPVLMNGHTLVPFRDIFESLGASVDWNGVSQTVTGIKADVKVTLQIGAPSASVNEKNMHLDTFAQIIDGHTMVPIRFISEALGAKVQWDQNTRTIEIASASDQEKKTLSVGTDAAYPPFEKQVDDNIVGFDVDLLHAIAEAEGLKVDVQHTGWDHLFTDINEGNVDIGMSAITMTDARRQVYDFSDPYFEAKQLIVVPKNSTVTKLDDLAGKRIGVQSATVAETLVQENFGRTYTGMKGYDDLPAAIDDLLKGAVDAVVGDNAVVMEYLKRLGNNGLMIVDDPEFPSDYYGFMVKKGNTKVLDSINEGLRKVKLNGKYDQIYYHYFSKINR